jgi:capsular polysaccharide transport system ATP-binding protein
LLSVRDLAKQFSRNGRPNVLFRDLSFDLPKGGRLALLGRNGQGKSTLIKILGGVIQPNGGSVRWSMSCSWPLGFGGGFQGGMTGLDSIRFIARIYRHPLKGLIDRVDRFAELGDALTMPMKVYSSGMRARLAFGLSLAIDFDCYLIDEIIAVGDAAFTKKCENELFGQRGDRAFIIASHDLEFLRKHCTKAIVIERGRAKVFDDVELAIAVYTAVWEENAVREAEAHRGAPASDVPWGRSHGDDGVPTTSFDDVARSTEAARAAGPLGDWWGRSVFQADAPAPGDPCPEVVDTTGLPRFLFYGPFAPLSRGIWRATVFLRLDEDAAACRLALQFGSEPSYAVADLAFGVAGDHRVELLHEFRGDEPSQIRLWLKKAAFHGKVRLIGATVERIGQLEQGEDIPMENLDV